MRYLTLETWAAETMEDPPSPATLRAYVKAGIIPAIKVGQRWYVHRDAELQPEIEVEDVMPGRVSRAVGL